MPFLPLSALLPLLTPLAARASLRILASYRPIGFTQREPTRVDLTGAVTTALCQNLDGNRLMREVPHLMLDHSDADDGVFAALYVGRGARFIGMMGLLDAMLRARPQTNVVAVTCGCITRDEVAILRSLMGGGAIRQLCWGTCGGSRELHAIRLALGGISPDEAIRLTPGLAADESPFLGA